MPAIIHARLDAETQALCRRLGKRLGWNESRIVREGIKALAVLVEEKARRRVVGQGKFASGIPDLAPAGNTLKASADEGGVAQYQLHRGLA